MLFGLRRPQPRLGGGEEIGKVGAVLPVEGKQTYCIAENHQSDCTVGIYRRVNELVSTATANERTSSHVPSSQSNNEPQPILGVPRPIRIALRRA